MIITVYATLLQKRAESERCRNFTTQAFSITYLYLITGRSKGAGQLPQKCAAAILRLRQLSATYSNLTTATKYQPNINQKSLAATAELFQQL